jgi:soluble lytic murein transglycosylase-like protein
LTDARAGRRRFRAEAGQALVLFVGCLLVLALGASVLGAFGKAFLTRQRQQSAADLAALSAARSMRDDFARLFEPSVLPDGRTNRTHLEKRQYLDRARRAAVRYAVENGARLEAVAVAFPDERSFAPVRVRVRLRGRFDVELAAGERPGRAVETEAVAEAELIPPARVATLPAAGHAAETRSYASGGGYSGPLAYRQGKPMRPDVALAFDRLAAAARAAGLTLVVVSGYRSDAEQARLFARNPDPRWVAPPGKSLHRLGTELDLGPPAAYGWLATNARRFGFLRRYSWEPWHYGYVGSGSAAVSSTRPAAHTAPDGASRPLPSFVPARYARAIALAAARWNVPAELLAGQLYAESNFNPFARSVAGALGIAQFMPGTARAYGLRNPFDAEESIDAQAHLMHDLLRRFGSVALALAAYNAGPGAVERYGGVPPYAETRAYVAKILGLLGGAGSLGGATPALEVRLIA